jgi:hypothetical protein
MRNKNKFRIFQDGHIEVLSRKHKQSTNQPNKQTDRQTNNTNNINTHTNKQTGMESIYRTQCGTGFQIVGAMIYSNPATDPLR